MTTLKTANLELHQVALATPLMSVLAYEALKDDIDMRGQLDPIITYRGKVVDGRHRLRALTELNIEDIAHTALPNNTTLTELEEIVQSKEIRRHETAGQLAIRAFRLKTQKHSKYSSYSKASKAIGANSKRVSEAKQIAEVYGRLDILELLFNGDQFNSGTAEIPFYTDSLGTILNWLKLHGTIAKASARPKVAPRVELTEDEQVMVIELYNRITDESKPLIEALAAKLYYYANESSAEKDT